MSTRPNDQAQRDRFVTELDRNFSVIAAAGAGKTTAITDRIVEIANDPQRARDWFPRLVVVTFTNRAADEMQQRARQSIFEKNVSPEVLGAFNRAFFGTIHSFCMKLLAGHGHHLGLPPRLELITDDEELWNDFVQRTTTVGYSLSNENRKALFRHIHLRDLMELGRRGTLPINLETREIPCPQNIDFRALRTYRAASNATRILALQKALPEWEQAFRDRDDFLPLIECTTSGRFREIWEETFREFNEWLSCNALAVAAEVQHDYRRFRAERGVVTFDDQIALALELTKNPDAISRIRAKDYIVVLDEAQDTDPKQFEILLEITRPPEAEQRWIKNPKIAPPRSGRFCMVGDFQQSIYGDRADLKQYRRVHEALVESGAGEPLEFSVTFRLDRGQLDFVNNCFREILNEEDDQVRFIELNPRPSALPGQVVRLDIAAPDLEIETPESAKARAEAAQLAEWIASMNLERLRARSWEHVAILCPRKKWFAAIADALRKFEIDSQIQSETDVKGDSPAHAWFTALLTIMTQPRCGFEIFGVLREVFGVSDHDLAVFCDGHGDRLQIETPSGKTDTVSGVLGLLAGIYSEVADKPLFSAVRRIVSGTSLRERLRTLPVDQPEELDAELDVLLESAASAEADGMTLQEFAEILRANFTTEREARTPRTGAVQLITCQKAKGLEWDTVIVPFFSRRIHTMDEDFPRIIIGRDGQAIVTFNKGDVRVADEEALKKANVQEMERLLYVALTRARHTLVLATDHQLFAKKHGDAPSASLTKWFRIDRGELNEQRVTELETTAAACDATRAYQSTKQTVASSGAKLRAPLEEMRTKARTRASDFSRRSIPSSFTPDEAIVPSTGVDKRKETETEFRASTVPSPATRYGIWWHDFVQRLSWNTDPDQWNALFEDYRKISPDPARSLREWKLLLAHLSESKNFRSQFDTDKSIAHAEMPFLWSENQHRCIEGVIDLALINTPQNRLLVLDWKTNDIKPERIDRLRAHYLPQLAAYWKAVSAIAKLEVEAAIYSTAVGALVRYQTDELEKEWARLEKLPVDQFDMEVATPSTTTSPTSASLTSVSKLEQLEFEEL